MMDELVSAKGEKKKKRPKERKKTTQEEKKEKREREKRTRLLNVGKKKKSSLHNLKAIHQELCLCIEPPARQPSRDQPVRASATPVSGRLLLLLLLLLALVDNSLLIHK